MKNKVSLGRQQATILLDPLLTDDAAIKAALRDRRSDFVYQSIHPADEEQYVADGWELQRMGKTAARIQRRKSGDRKLEDRVWVLLARMGYPVLGGNRFHITYMREIGTHGKKQVDVFAKDDETVIVVECKYKDVRGRKSLQKDIHETEALQKPFANSIRQHFGADYKPKILWFYVTENIIWSEPDIERAEGANIKIISENELQYFESYVSHVGSAGKYQFLAEYLAGQEIPGLANMKIPATRGYLGADKFYAFTISARILLKVAFVNHQALNHPDSRPAYQRMISKSRLQAIGTFIQDGGYFPTNILINFTAECNFDLLGVHKGADGTRFGLLNLPSKYKSAFVIDGQHRLFGFTNLPEKYLDLPLFVIAFENLPPKKEADLFITINHEQKSVPKSLLIALQADLKMGSSDPRQALSAVASSLVRVLANDITSPFFRRFEIPSVVPSDSQNLTLAEVVKGLTQSRLLGRMAGKRNRVPGHLSAATDEGTIERARKVLNGYFKSIMDTHPARWNAGRSAYICVNPGVRAHLRLLQEILTHFDASGKIDPMTADSGELVEKITKFIAPILTWIKTTSDQEIYEKLSRKFGESGVTEYYFELCKVLNEKHPDFGGEEFQSYKSRKADQRIKIADQIVNDLQMSISKIAIENLKKIHGTNELESGEKAYWELGIEDTNIKKDAYRKQQESPIAKRGPREAYLDLIDFEKIIRQRSNWDRLAPFFNIPLRDVNPKSKTYHLDWLSELNQIRRVAAHKSPYRNYKDEDHSFLEWLKNEIYERAASNNFELEGG
jgi:DNA sulfur modification protein DndB